MRRGLAAVIAAAAVVAPSAQAASVPFEGASVSRGPVLAGDASIWTQGGDRTSGFETPIELRMATPSGATSLLDTLAPPPSGAHDVVELAASPTRVALVRREAVQTPDPFGGTYVGWSRDGSEIWVGRPDGRLEFLEGNVDLTSCDPRGVALDGDLLAVTRANCGEREVVVRDLSQPGAPERVIPTPDDHELTPSALVAIAGRYVAWEEHHFDSDGPRPPAGPDDPRRTTNIVVYDLTAGREAYRLDFTPYMQGLNGTYGHTLDLDSDGTLAVTMPPGEGMALRGVLWISAGAPDVLHRVDFPTNPFTLSLRDGLMAGRRLNERDYAVVDLEGNVRNVFAYGFSFNSPEAEIDFDGERLTWAEDQKIHNEPYPVVATPDLPEGTLPVNADGIASLPVWCPDPRAACRGSVRLSKRATSGRKRFRVAARRTKGVRLRVSRRTQRRLRRGRRVAVRATVVTRQGTGRRAVVLVRRRAG